MPIEYSVREDGCFVYAIASGALTTDEIIDYQKQLAADPQIRHGEFRELFDARRAIDNAITQESMNAVSEMLHAQPDLLAGQQVAIVVGNQTSYTKAKYYENLVADQENIIVFNELSTALTWLGIEDDTLL